jgi:hypothetical protein
MYALTRKRFEMESLLSPAFAKTLEEKKVETEPASLSVDIFRIDVGDFLDEFADGEPAYVPLKPVNQNMPFPRAQRENAPAKENPVQAAFANADQKKKTVLTGSTRFGFTKH